MRFLLQCQPPKRQKRQFFDDFFVIFQKNANFLPKSEMFLQKMVNKACPLSVLSTLSGKYPAVVKYPPTAVNCRSVPSVVQFAAQ